jgi:phosphoserine phosphatase
MDKIAFDVDGTLIDMQDRPNYDVIELLLWFQKHGWETIVWSGGGVEYAKHWRDKLGLESYVVEKGSIVVDIVVDDEDCLLGDVLIKVNGNYNFCK